MNLKTYTIQDIRDLNPCYDPSRYLSEDWTGTAIDVLRVKDCSAEDRLWVTSFWIDDRTLRLFAVWCARNALALVEKPDPRSIAACDVAEQYENGEATSDELAAAWDAAWAAARDAARDAARAAARDAAWAAARDAAWAAARDAARDAQIEHLIEMLEE